MLQKTRMNDMTPQIQQNIATIEQLYSVENPDAVRDFLSNHPDILGVVSEAPEHLKRFFGDVKPKLSTSATDDFENPVILLARVPIAGPRREARAILKAFDEEWGYDALSSGDEYLFHITIGPDLSGNIPLVQLCDIGK